MGRELPVRKEIRLPGYDYSRAGYYFVTFCVKDRHELLGAVVGATDPGRPPVVELTALGKCIEKSIQIACQDGIRIDKYVIMPNHVHCIIEIFSRAGDRGRSPLQYIIRSVKSYSTKKFGYSVWQKSFHDHIIRDEAEYQKVWHYIDQNPASWPEDCYHPTKTQESGNTVSALLRNDKEDK